MPIKQREVYYFPHPQTKVPHLFIVLSVEDANEYENSFVGVMITTSDYYNQDLSFFVNDDMFLHPLKYSDSKVRMHLIAFCKQSNLGNPVNEMKEPFFKNMMREIGDIVFGYSFKPL